MKRQGSSESDASRSTITSLLESISKQNSNNNFDNNNNINNSSNIDNKNKHHSSGSNNLPFRSSNLTELLRNHFTASMHRRRRRRRKRQRASNTFRPSFMFTDYRPKQFANLRALFGISNEDYLSSFKSTTMPSFSEGRSGAFIYFSSDRKYIVKTTTDREFLKLMQILPDYERYFMDELSSGHDPLITRFLGAHKIVMYDIPLYFVIMQNVCPSVNEKYDLKGSWVNRHSSKKSSYNPELSRPKKFTIPESDKLNRVRHHPGGKDGATLFLDNDLQNCFLLHPHVARALSQQILRDIKLLESKYSHVVLFVTSCVILSSYYCNRFQSNGLQFTGWH